MPVITRSQSAKMREDAIVERNASVKKFYSPTYVIELNNLLGEFDATEDVKHRIEIILKLFEKIDKNLPIIVDIEGIDKWNDFLCGMHIRIDELNDLYYSGELNNINKILVNKLLRGITKTNYCITKIIGKYFGI